KWVDAVGRVVEHRYARRGGQQLAAVHRRQRVAGLDVHRLGVARVDGDAGAAGRYPDVGPAEDLAGLVHELELLVGGVGVGGEAARLRNHAEGDLVGGDRGGRDLAGLDDGAGLGVRLPAGALPGPRQRPL